MKTGALFSGLVVLLLIATISPKLVYEGWLGVPDEVAFANDLSAMLEKKGYSRKKVTISGYPAFVARKGPCRLLAGRVGERGYDIERYTQWAQRFGPLQYYYRGQLESEFPRTRPLLERRLARYAYAFGLPARPAPIVAISASRECDIEALDLAGLELDYRDADTAP